MSIKLNNFLKCYESKGEHTHTSISKGKWEIPDDKMEEFFVLYTDAINENEELHLTEKHILEAGPIVIDLDFRFKEEIEPRPINEKIIEKIVKDLTNILREMFGEENYSCFVLQRPCGYKKKEYWNDGLHIQFPYIICEYIFQFALRNKFINTCDIEVECETKLKDIYDDSVIKNNNWCMYLSTKPGIKPYELKWIFNSDNKPDDYTVLELVKLLSIRNKTKKEILKPINYDVGKYDEQIIGKLKNWYYLQKAQNKSF